MPDYLAQLVERFWLYRDWRFPNRPDVFMNHRKQPNRPPVFRAEFADLNPVAPASHRQAVLGTLPVLNRHKWFSSMRSSQALTQSVFGTLKVLDKLHLLTNVMADDDGDFAFFTDARSPSECHLEHPCTSLGELPDRETKSDVFFGGAHEVSVECKLAEDAFGPCSQPTILPTAPNYDRDLCDGTYTQQRSRRERCSLTERESSTGNGFLRCLSGTWKLINRHAPCACPISSFEIFWPPNPVMPFWSTTLATQILSVVALARKVLNVCGMIFTTRADCGAAPGRQSAVCSPVIRIYMISWRS